MSRAIQFFQSANCFHFAKLNAWAYRTDTPKLGLFAEYIVTLRMKRGVKHDADVQFYSKEKKKDDDVINMSYSNCFQNVFTHSLSLIYYFFLFFFLDNNLFLVIICIKFAEKVYQSNQFTSIFYTNFNSFLLYFLHFQRFSPFAI